MFQMSNETMPKMDQDHNPCELVSEFYNGKSIFMTGASGFLGSVLLEVLLRSFPDAKGIYILLRDKKGVNAHERKNEIFKKLIFKNLLLENPEVIDKVHVIEGNVSKPNLGMRDADFEEIAENVSIFFHVAACISFSKPLKFTLEQNCLATHYALDMCKRFQKLEVFVYTSTAFSNCNQKYFIDEIIYPLPWKGERFLDTLINGSEDDLKNMVSKCKPGWPNDYTFSKCLSENIIAESEVEFPVVIIRPSIIVTTWKGTLPGYVEEGSGLTELTKAVGIGFARVILCDPNSRLDFTPVDVVSNVHVVAAWCAATKRLQSPLIINSTGHNWIILFREYVNDMLVLSRQHLLPKSFQEVNVILVKNKFLYWMLVFYEHYLPALVLDPILALQRKKRRLFPLYKFFTNLNSKHMSFFMSTTFHFAGKNYAALSQYLDEREKEVFYMDLTDANALEMSMNVPNATTIYDFKLNDKKSYKSRKRTVFMNTMLINFIKRLFLVLCCLLCFLIFKFLF